MRACVVWERVVVFEVVSALALLAHLLLATPLFLRNGTCDTQAALTWSSTEPKLYICELTVLGALVVCLNEMVRWWWIVLYACALQAESQHRERERGRERERERRRGGGEKWAV